MSTFKEDLLDGKVAVVTGGTSGIGLAIAVKLAQHGATVHALGLGADKLDADLYPNIFFKELDVTDDKRLEAIYKTLDRLDLIVPAAGISLGERELGWDEFNKVLSIQLNAVYRTIQLGYQLLVKNGGSVITIASMYAFFGGGKQVAYSTSKGGVVQMTKSLAQAYAPDNIRINSIAPGWIDTPLLRTQKDNKELSDRIMHRIPLKRYGLPEEIANVVLFLTSDAASYITGTVLPVDGGYLVTGT